MKFVDAAKDDDGDGRADSSARDEARFDPRLLGDGGGEGDDGEGARVSRAARGWEGVWPAAADDAAALGPELRARGFAPLAVSAGDLVVIAGTLDHLSLPNHSPDARHTFQLHMIEGPAAGVQWAPENWLQYPGGAAFPSL